MTAISTCIVALGCSGPVVTPVLRGFLTEGVTLRILARSPEPRRPRCPFSWGGTLGRRIRFFIDQTALTPLNIRLV